MRIISRIVTILVAAILISLITPVAAIAEGVSDDPVFIVAPSSLNWFTIIQVFVIPALLPALVGLVNRWTTLPTFVKRVLLAILALASQVLTEWLVAAQAGRAYDLWMALFLGFVAYFVAEGTYQKFYKASLHTEDPGSGSTSLPLHSVEGDPQVVTLEVQPEPVTIASKIAGK